MAENINALILPIGADATQFERSINDVKSAFKELSATIAATPFNLVTDKQKLQLNALKETLTVLTTDVKTFGQAVKIPENSILGLTQRIAELNKKKISLDAKTSASEIARLTKEIEKLTTQKNNIDGLGRSISQIGAVSQTAFSKVQDTSKGARMALTSLSLVAQDAPFGFIGIQNNLPALIQTFGALKAQAGSVKGALSQLGAALIGPAGLFLAFSAATAAVTFAVQKYGSFGAAVDALFGKIDPLKNTLDRLNKSYEDYNKELKSNAEITALADKSQSGLVETVSILSKKATDLSTSEQQRGKYLNQLKEIDKGYFGQLNTGAENVDKIKQATDGYTTALIANSRVKAFQQQLEAVDAQIAPLEVLRTELKKSNVEAEALRKTSTKLFVDPTEKVTKSLAENATQIAKLTEKRTLIIDGLEEAIVGFKSLKTEATDLSKTKFTLTLESQDLDAAFNLDKIKSNITKFGNVLIDSNNSIEERKNALKELVAINPQVFNALTLEKNGLVANKNILEENIRSLEVLTQSRKDDARASEINTQFRNQQLKSQDAAVKAEEDAFESLVKLTYGQDQYGNSTDKSTRLNNKFVESLGELQDIDQGVLDILTKGLGVENTYEKAIKDLLNFEEYQKATADRISRNFRFLQRPLENLFDTVLEDGIANWQAFGDAVVSEIKKIAAALLAKSFITLLGNLLAPGVGSLLGAGFSGISDDVLGEFLGNGAKVNFAGVQGGGMQMAGSVNLTLRGSDLVGSINRTNSTINRVG